MSKSYEELSDRAKEAYQKRNKVRRTSMFIAIGLIVICMIISLISGDPFQESLLGSVLLGCLIHGFIHTEFLLKDRIKKFFKSMITIVFFPFNAIMLSLALVVAFFVGFPCLIIDLILYLTKKPLVYSFENESLAKI
ncbi:MAG: hypothetical protein HDT23_06365 [Ruminococcus sp.]|nr:hypothetical protein [Ruminococcus sp.]